MKIFVRGNRFHQVWSWDRLKCYHGLTESSGGTLGSLSDLYALTRGIKDGVKMWSLSPSPRAEQPGRCLRGEERCTLRRAACVTALKGFLIHLKNCNSSLEWTQWYQVCTRVYTGKPSIDHHQAHKADGGGDRHSDIPPLRHRSRIV